VMCVTRNKSNQEQLTHSNRDDFETRQQVAHRPNATHLTLNAKKNDW